MWSSAQWVNAVQWCCIENQKGSIVVDFCTEIVPFGSQWNTSFTLSYFFFWGGWGDPPPPPPVQNLLLSRGRCMSWCTFPSLFPLKSCTSFETKLAKICLLVTFCNCMSAQNLSKISIFHICLCTKCMEILVSSIALLIYWLLILPFNSFVSCFVARN